MHVFHWLGLMAGEEVDYSWQDVRDKNGADAGFHADLIDSLAPCNAARSEVLEPNRFLSRYGDRFERGRLLLYLEKSLNEAFRPTIWRILVIAWLQRTENSHQEHNGVLTLERTPWLRFLQEYAAEQGVALRGYPVLYRKPKFPPRRQCVMGIKLALHLSKSLVTLRTRKTAQAPLPQNGSKAEFTIAVPDTAHGLNFDSSKYSDLFWVPFAEPSPDQLLVYVSRADDPLDQSKYEALRESSIRAVAIRRLAIAGATVPTWPSSVHVPVLAKQLLRDWKLLLPAAVKAALSRGADRWIKTKFLGFLWWYQYWKWFFSSFNVKLHVDVADLSKIRVASDQAIADLGGLSVTYQRSYEPFAGVMRASAVDVHFGFSSTWAESESKSRSHIAQFVSNGYVRDYAFTHVQGRASRLRRELSEHGAQFVISFFDEGSTDDKKLGPSHAYRGENYRYLLDKLLSDPTLGLVLKPKDSASLRRRLGTVTALLDNAIETGRCFVYDLYIPGKETLPCEASLAADLNIGLLYGGTASLEAALAGSVTLLIDRELTTFHPLYMLEEGQVVFRDWDSLWEALTTYRADPGAMPRFGNWEPHLDRHDQFRDGKAAERMGEYISWLCQGLTEGMSREEAMEFARLKYVALWGADKVVDLRRGSLPSSQTAAIPQLAK